MMTDKPEEKKQLTELRQEPLSLWDELNIVRIKLDHHAHEDFHRSQWQSGQTSKGFLIYRWLLAAFFGSGLAAYLKSEFRKGHWFLYLTNWGFLLCSVTSISGAIFVSLYHKDPEKMTSRTCLNKCYWACYYINLIVAHIIAIVYWTFIYPADQTEENPLRTHPIFNIWTHALPPLLFTLDHMVVAHPTRLLHFVYPLGFAWVYMGFTYVYYLLGGLDPRGRPYIYGLLNYTKPFQAVQTMGMTAALLLFCSTLQYGLYRLRVYIARKLGKLQ